MASSKSKPLSERGRFWHKHIIQWMQTAKTQTQFCRERKLSLAAFGWWRRRLRRSGWIEDHQAALARHFVEVPLGRPTSVDSSAWYEIHLVNQRRLRVPPGFDTEAVTRLVAILESSC